ncbi:hypothetical protein [Cohnella sp. REN36]|uniref:hypothetical protein n=1 Tax=Cohnella sp. REN36 TaxID=2887347 RepID=UPI001D138E25|nr:hypothetical protein [Cohnella sp. REN36]MCC3373109.1 hypothetical protein [Cohnella sp. REN36]
MASIDSKAIVQFRRLFVNVIEDSSGIFIGTNQAIGWMSSSKSNYGFGSLKDATLSNAVCYVYDPDLVDNSVRDARAIAITETPETVRQTAIDFQSVNVNAMLNASAVDLGDIRQPGWRTARKNNYGAGKIYGASRLSRTVNIVFDDDAEDASFDIRQQALDVGGAAGHVQIVQKPPDEAVE